MAWIKGTATNYRTMLDQLIQIATSNHIDSATIVAGGTGFAVDNIITFTDGTFTHAGKLRVTSVGGGGAITGVIVEEGGAYTVNPDLTANPNWTVSPAGGSGATFDLTMNSEPWTIERRAQEAVSATIANGGSGYSVGNTLTLAMTGGGILGATGYGVAPVFQVATVGGGGAITSVTLVTSGHLERVPDVDTGTGGFQAQVTGGAGTGAVLTVTYQNVDSTKEDVVVLSGPGESGTDQILCAFRTFQELDVSGLNTVRNWQLLGLVEWNPALALHAQNNISIGLDSTTGVKLAGGGCFMVLKETDSRDIDFWMSVTNRRIILICKVRTATTTFYPSMYVGFINAFETTNENPYPLWIQGSSSRSNSWFGDTVIARITGLSDAYAISSHTNGPAQYRVNGVWTAFKNSTGSDGGSPTRNADSDYTIGPAGLVTLLPPADDQITQLPSNGLSFESIHPASGVPGTTVRRLRPTINTGDDIRILIPLSVLSTDNPTGMFIYLVHGELDGCWWISASDPTLDLTSEDVQKVGADRYLVFQNGNQNQIFSYFCVKQE